VQAWIKNTAIRFEHDTPGHFEFVNGANGNTMRAVSDDFDGMIAIVSTDIGMDELPVPGACATAASTTANDAATGLTRTLRYR
jgi:hypothetical protein